MEAMDSFGIGPGIGLRQFGRAVDYSGRSTRSELISFWIVAFIFGIAIHVLGTFAFSSDSWPFDALLELITLVIAVPWAALMVRRLHDQDRSGWWLAILIGFWAFAAAFGDDDPRHPETTMGNAALVVGFLVSLAHFVMSLAPGSRDVNRFGQDPRLDAATT
jgi:uncharacterized membrane protein YhaH (DUF805 family)